MFGRMSSKAAESVHLQDAHRFDPRCAPSGEVHRHRSNEDKHQRNGSEGDGIDGAHVVEHAFD